MASAPPDEEAVGKLATSSPAASSAVRARGLRVAYRSAKGGMVTAVEGLDLDVTPREFVALIGPSGCGKSTFLRAIGDLLPKADVTGELSVFDRSAREARLGHEFAFVFQSPVLLPWRTALDNVKLPTELLPRGRVRKDPIQLLEMVGLSGFERALPRECSGGMCSRIAIARALMTDPPLLLMDEPFAAVDEITRDRLNLALLHVWEATSAAVIFVTHSIVEAAFLADRVVVMTKRPGQVKGIVDIDFPRPRALDLRKTVEFLDYTNEIRDLLEHEVVGSSDAGGLREARQ